MNHIIAEKDVVVLWTSDNRIRTIRVLKELFHKTHLGELPLSRLIGMEFGSRFELTKGWGLALPPAMEDRIHMVRRSTNILYPKDIGLILMKMPIAPGSKVIEFGTGAGAMTAALGAAVSPGGTVYTFDVLEERIKGAKKNVRRSGIQADIRFGLRQPKTPLQLEPVDSVILDIPEPWEEIDVIDQVLLKGGRLAAMNPTYNQVEKMASAMAKKGFIMIEGMENIFRRIVVVEGRVRPSRIAVPHTEFMLFGIKSGEIIPDDVDQYSGDR